MSLPAAPVTVEGPMRVQPVGGSRWSIVNVSVSPTPQLVLSRDIQRKRVVIVANAHVHLADSQQRVESLTGVAKGLAPSLSLELFQVEELWIASDVAATTATLFVEQWMEKDA